MEEFLSSKTMITPGIAGGLTTLITAALSTQFNLPGRWVALIFSLLLSGVIFLADKRPPRFPVRLLFLILNTFIIFSVAVGANTAGMATVTKSNPPIYESSPRDAGTKRFFHDWFGS